MKVLLGNSLWQLLRQSDKVSCFVILILGLASVVCWTIVVYKIILYRIKVRQIKKFISSLKGIQSFDGLLELNKNSEKTLPGDFLSQILNQLKTLLNKQDSQEKVLSKLDWQQFLERSDQSVSEVLCNEETYLPVLSTAAAVSPLLGLFGTVWGLVHSFIRISEQQAADITVVAPGIAEALMTTLAGLIVAIPALVMFNYLSSNVRAVEQQLFFITDYVSSIVYKKYVQIRS